MIDKTMCEALWRNISDFYANLRVKVGILAMYFYLGQEQKDACKRNLCYIYLFVWFWNIVDQMSDKFESQHSLSPTIWSDIVVGRESGYLKIFFTFLGVNMSNIL